MTDLWRWFQILLFALTSIVWFRFGVTSLLKASSDANLTRAFLLWMPLMMVAVVISGFCLFLLLLTLADG